MIRQRADHRGYLKKMAIRMMIGMGMPSIHRRMDLMRFPFGRFQISRTGAR